MIARDEGDVIERALKSAAELVDEIIVIDTGSTDGTQNIYRAFGAKVHEIELGVHFAKARNEALSLANRRLDFWLDADEELVPGVCQAFCVNSILKRLLSFL